MFELTIAQGIIVAFALIIGTIIIAQPFRRKVIHTRNEIKLDTFAHRKIIVEVFEELQRALTERFAPVVTDYQRLKQAEEASKAKPRKSRAGEIRKPSTLPKNATAEEKRKLKNRLRSRERRAKQRASRSAESGRFVSQEEAKKNPKTTVNETITRKK